MRKSSRRRGFTLPEVLVTVTIVAVLAAVMVPAVINQVAKGDLPAVSQDVAALRTSVTTFAADTRGFPQRLSQLGKASLALTDTAITGSPFGAEAVAGYKGPYASITAGHAGPTGAIFSDSLKVVDTRTICMQDSTSNALHTGTSKVTPAQMAMLELALDNGTTLDAGGAYTTTGSNTTGAVRWSQTLNTGVVTINAGTVRVCLTSF